MGEAGSLKCGAHVGPYAAIFHGLADMALSDANPNVDLYPK
jgi:hypothetical protein